MLGPTPRKRVSAFQAISMLQLVANDIHADLVDAMKAWNLKVSNEPLSVKQEQERATSAIPSVATKPAVVNEEPRLTSTGFKNESDRIDLYMDFLERNTTLNTPADTNDSVNDSPLSHVELYKEFLEHSVKNRASQSAPSTPGMLI